MQLETQDQSKVTKKIGILSVVKIRDIFCIPASIVVRFSTKYEGESVVNCLL